MQADVIVRPGIADDLATSELARIAEAAAIHAGIQHECEISILISDDEEMRILNRRYRAMDQTTDVLSFAQRERSAGAPDVDAFGDEPELLGDVVISYERAVEQATEAGQSLERELAWLVVHGTLQLLGYTHDSDEEERAMRAMEAEILHRLGY